MNYRMLWAASGLWAALALVFLGCSHAGNSNTASTNIGTQVDHEGHDHGPGEHEHEDGEHEHVDSEHASADGEHAHSDGEHAHDHSGWWCGEHGIPEAECSMCSSKVAAEFQEKGDWCDKHERALSQCFICDPDAQDRYAEVYRAKEGKDPPPVSADSTASDT